MPKKVARRLSTCVGGYIVSAVWTFIVQLTLNLWKLHKWEQLCHINRYTGTKRGIETQRQVMVMVT